MTLPFRCCCLAGLVLALLLQLAQSHAIGGSSTERPIDYDAANEQSQYEVIDVEQQNRNASHVSTGQTTRIITNGDVDDSFWLQHLGDDFKHAIHLQIGGNDEVFNTTVYEPRSQSQPQPQPPISIADADRHVPADAMHPVKEPAVADVSQQSNTTASSQTSRSQDSESRAQEKSDFTAAKSEIAEHQSFERASKPQAAAAQQTTKAYRKPTDKYASSYTIKLVRNKGGRHRDNRLQSTVVINLPDSESKVHQLDDSKTPIIVKLPPVIYHSKPSTHHDLTAQGSSAEEHEADAGIPKEQHTNDLNYAQSEQQQQISASAAEGYYSPYPLPNLYDPPAFEDQSYNDNSQDSYGASPYDGFSRISRSSQDFYYKGL